MGVHLDPVFMGVDWESGATGATWALGASWHWDVPRALVHGSSLGTWCHKRWLVLGWTGSLGLWETSGSLVSKELPGFAGASRNLGGSRT